MRKFLFVFSLLFVIPVFCQEKLTNELIWFSREFRGGYVSGLTSMNDGVHYTQLDYDRESKSYSINKYAYASGEKMETLVSTSELEGLDAIDDYEFSADESKLLLATDQEGIYRHSTKSNYYVYDL